MLDKFYIYGPNGRHLCLASEPTRCTVAESKECSLVWMFSLDAARAIAAQSILGVQAMQESGVIHGSEMQRTTAPWISDRTFDRFTRQEYPP